MRSSERRCASTLSRSSEHTNVDAPMLFAYASFVLEREITVTSHPNAPAIFTAICPSPSNPTTPTLDPRVAPYRRIGSYTVTPAHITGPANRASNPLGIDTANRSSTTCRVAYPPLVSSPIGCVRARPNLSFAPYVPTMPLAHICSSPDAHLAHARQLSTTHPTPTASPTVNRVTSDPIAAHVPASSCPGQYGYSGFGITPAMCPAAFTTSL